MQIAFILAGQSNMAGRGEMATAKGDDADACDNRTPPVHDDGNEHGHRDVSTSRLISYFSQRPGDERWVTPATDPLHADKPEKAGVGPGLSFAGEVLKMLGPRRLFRGGVDDLDDRRGEEADVRILLIPCAWGGSPISRWAPPGGEADGGDLFREAVRRTRLALDTAPGVASGNVEGGLPPPPPPPPPPTLGGILWHQGESDCGDASLARSHAESTARTLGGLRAALGAPSDLPLVVGELGTFLDTLNDERFGHADVVQAGLEGLPSRMSSSSSSCAYVSARGLMHRGDGLHFDAASQLELGRRYAGAWMRVQNVVDVPEGFVGCDEEEVILRGGTDDTVPSGGERRARTFERGVID